MTTLKEILRKAQISRATALSLTEDRDSFYKFYSIIKPNSNKRRYIQEPIGDLKKVQRRLTSLLSEYSFHPSCKAISGESIKTNANPHQESKFVLKIDIFNCYPATTEEMIVAGMLKSNDYNWLGESIKALPFCLIQNKGKLVLPTGAPTSPALCNIALTPLDYKISSLCKEQGYVYTRYIDDIHISTTKETRNWNIIDQVKEIIESTGYKCNTEKSKWYTVDERDNVIVTGLRIGKQNKIPKALRRKIRTVLEHRAKYQLSLDDTASGYLAFVKGISRKEYSTLLEYYQRRLNSARNRQ